MSPSDAEEEEEAAAVVSSCCSPVLSMLTLVSQPPPPRSATRGGRPGFLGLPRPVKNGRPPPPGHTSVPRCTFGAVNDKIHGSLVVGGSCCDSGRRGAGGSLWWFFFYADRRVEVSIEHANRIWCLRASNVLGPYIRSFLTGIRRLQYSMYHLLIFLCAGWTRPNKFF